MRAIFIIQVEKISLCLALKIWVVIEIRQKHITLEHVFKACVQLFLDLLQEFINLLLLTIFSFDCFLLRLFVTLG